MTTIHPTAIVDPKAQIEEGVTVDAYAVIASPHVVLKKGVTVKSHAYIEGHTTIDEGTTIWPFASIGTQTQDLKYQGETTYVHIGKHCHIREYVTVNSSCGEGTQVTIGDNCLIMAYCHVAHNCSVKEGVIMANGATLAGHVTVDEHAVLGGLSAVHQFTRVGAYAMVGGGGKLGQDLPPFTLGSGYPAKVQGLNLTGLKRHKIPLSIRKDITKAYRLTYQSELSLEEALQEILANLPEHAYRDQWVHFCRTSTRGLAHCVQRYRKK